MSAVIAPTDAADVRPITRAVMDLVIIALAIPLLCKQRDGASTGLMLAYYSERIRRKRAALMLAYAEVMDITGEA